MHASLEQLHARYAQTLDGRSSEALEVHPANDAGCWNARQIVEHLILTYRSSASAFQKRLEKGRPTQTKLTMRQRGPRLVVLGLGFMPRGQVSPPMVTPAADAGSPLDGAALADAMRSELQRMDDLLSLCERQFGEQQMATHQVLGPLSASQWRRFHVTHGRHHFKQIRRIGLSV
jgi:DinB superfamily